MSEQQKNKTRWWPIIADMLKLIVVMGGLGAACKLAMKPFEAVSPIETLVSLVRNNDASAFDKSLRKGLEGDAGFINAADKEGRTPLMWTVYAHYNNPALARAKDADRSLFLRKLLAVPGVDVSARDKDGFTALHWAAWSGLPLSATLLVQAGADINSLENAGYTPLMLAALRGNDDVVRLLLRLGADTAPQVKGKTAQQLAEVTAAAYAKRDSRAYSLIFSEKRLEAYRNTIALFAEPPARCELDALLSEADAEAKAAKEAATAQPEEEETPEEAAADTAEKEAALPAGESLELP
ncbi:MAG: ankyrin repeat domain-containing protein [Akkermansia sp.]